MRLIFSGERTRSIVRQHFQERKVRLGIWLINPSYRAWIDLKHKLETFWNSEEHFLTR